MHLNELLKIHPNETVQKEIRHHWVTYIPTVVLYAVLALIPIGVYYMIIFSGPTNVLSDPFPRALLTLLFSVYELSVALFFYSSFLIYYLGMIIVTNERMIEISQENLFSRTISELDLFKIQDATSEIHGVIPTILNYGTITIQTAGEQEHFTFKNIPSPDNFRRQLMELADQDREFHRNPSGPLDH